MAQKRLWNFENEIAIEFIATNNGFNESTDDKFFGVLKFTKSYLTRPPSRCA